MTQLAYLVTMNGLRLEDLAAKLDAFSARTDPDDPKGRQRLNIVAAASDLFASHGFRKTTVDQIAARAGVAKGTLYLYFENKADLVVAAIVEEKRRYLERFSDFLDPSLGPRERLRRWLCALLSIGSDMPLVSRLMGGDREILAALYQVGADRGEDWYAMQLHIVGQMVDAAARPHGWTAEETADRARVLFGLAFFASLVSEERVRGGLSVERYAAILADMIVDGIGTPSKGGRE